MPEIEPWRKVIIVVNHGVPNPKVNEEIRELGKEAGKIVDPTLETPPSNKSNISRRHSRLSRPLSRPSLRS